MFCEQMICIMTMCMVQKCLKLKPRLGGHWRVGIQDEPGTHSSCRVCIQTVGYAFKISRVLIQDVDPSFTLCCVCEVGWLPIVQVFVAALICQSCLCIKTGLKCKTLTNIDTITHHC